MAFDGGQAHGARPHESKAPLICSLENRQRLGSLREQPATAERRLTGFTHLFHGDPMIQSRLHDGIEHIDAFLKQHPSGGHILGGGTDQIELMHGLSFRCLDNCTRNYNRF